MKRTGILILIFLGFIFSSCSAQKTEDKPAFTHADTLRGSVSPERAWWNVLHYDITVKLDYINKRIEGYNIIEFDTKNYPEVPVMQIDLQEPM